MAEIGKMGAHAIAGWHVCFPKWIIMWDPLFVADNPSVVSKI